MNRDIDLYLTPIGRIAGEADPGLLSLHVSDPTGKATRSRKFDRLILYLVMVGDRLLRSDQQKQLLVYLSDFYFKKPGSTTAAMRSVAEELNKILLEINLRYAKKGQQGIGLLTLLVFRKHQLYLTQSGPMQAFHISGDNVQHLYDSSMISKGLGQGSSIPISYYPLQVKHDDGILLAAKPPLNWSTAAVLEVPKLTQEEISSRLSAQLAPDLNVVVINVKKGKGDCYIVKDGDAVNEVERNYPPTEEEILEGPTVSPLGIEAEREPEGRKEASAELNPGEPSETTPEYIREVPSIPSEPVTLAEMTPPSTTGIYADPEDRSREVAAGDKVEDIDTIWTKTAAFVAGILAFVGRLFRGVAALLTRVLPGEDYFKLPSGTMAFIAVVVPILVVGIASGAYYKLGREAQYDAYYSQAQEMANNAVNQADDDLRRSEWAALLDFLEQVESVNKTEDTQALKLEAVAALDNLDLVKRVNYQPAIIGGLPESARIIKMVVFDNDLYMLDGTSGSVFYAQLTSQGYKPDASFQCGPAALDSVLSGPIIDIARWPKGLTPDADIVGMDSMGNLIFCEPGDSPQGSAIFPPNSVQYQNLAAMTIHQGDLYVLDPTSNGVWIYWNGAIAMEPELFFDVEIPPLDSVVDLTVNNNELYLLHDDGSTTLCVYSSIGVAPTRCSNPQYLDTRAGHENEPMELENAFSQIEFNPPPDPSLFMLDPNAQSIYHFSLRNLTYQKQFKPDFPPESGKATAFAYDPLKRNFFLAVGNDIYYGLVP